MDKDIFRLDCQSFFCFVANITKERINDLFCAQPNPSGWLVFQCLSCLLLACHCLLATTAYLPPLLACHHSGLYLVPPSRILAFQGSSFTHCTLHTPHTVQSIVYSTQGKLHTTQHTIQTTHFTLHISCCKLKTVSLMFHYNVALDTLTDPWRGFIKKSHVDQVSTAFWMGTAAHSEQRTWTYCCLAEV